MSREIVKTVLVLSYILYHVFDWYLAYLDEKHMNAGIPENVRDVYNEEEYGRWISGLFIQAARPRTGWYRPDKRMSSNGMRQEGE